MDNVQIKDGVGNLFTLRMKDISPAADGTLQRSMILASAYPLDYGQGGMFQHCAKSGTIAAGLAANAPLYAFQNPGALLSLLRRVRVSAWALGTAFTGGLAIFDIFAARAFTAQYTGGTTANLAGEAGQLRTSMAASQASIVYASTGALTIGTRTLDPDPLDSCVVAVPTAANTPFSAAPLTLFEKLQDEHPYLMAANEGFVIRATVPGTGTWGCAVTSEWDEVSTF